MSINEKGYNGYILLLNDSPWTYEEAEPECLSRGRYPVSFGSEAEFNDVRLEWENEFGQTEFWVGMKNINPSGSTNTADFYWIDGTDRTYDGFWKAGQPNNDAPGQPCVNYDANANGLEDKECDGTHATGIICETQTFQPTENPTAEPAQATSTPTAVPSSSPTKSTSHPSSSPTPNPSATPTASPTAASESPTMSTGSPTLSTSVPSGAPTKESMTPTQYPTEYPTVGETENDGDDEVTDSDSDDSDGNTNPSQGSGSGNNSGSDDVVVAISVVGSVLGCCFLVFCAGMFYKFQDMQNKLREAESKVVQSHSPRSGEQEMEIDFNVSLEGEVVDPDANIDDVMVQDQIEGGPNYRESNVDVLFQDRNNGSTTAGTNRGKDSSNTSRTTGHGRPTTPGSSQDSGRRLSNVDELYRKQPGKETTTTKGDSDEGNLDESERGDGTTVTTDGSSLIEV